MIAAISPYIHHRLAPGARTRAGILTSLIVFFATLLIANVNFTLGALQWSIATVIFLAYFSPQLRLRNAPAHLLVSTIGIVSAILISWRSMASLPRHLRPISGIRTLNTIFESVFNDIGLAVLLFAWTVLWLLFSIHHQSTPYEPESPTRSKFRKALFIAIALGLLSHLWLFQQSGIGPLECPPELQLENLPNTDQVHFNDEFLKSRMPKSRLLNRWEIQNWSREERHHTYKVVSQTLSDPNFAPKAPELYFISQLAGNLKYELPPSRETTEFSATLLKFAREHNREFLFGPELHYFWHHGLTYLAKTDLSRSEFSKWRALEEGLHLDDDDEVAILRTTDDWTCAVLKMRFFGREFQTTPYHLCREARIRWGNLSLGTPSRENWHREQQFDSQALRAILSLKKSRYRSLVALPQLHAYYSERDDVLTLYGDRSRIYRQTKEIQFGGTSSTPTSPTDLPASLCRCADH